MARARIIIKRRKAVRNTRKITKVMQMIATARYQKAYKRALGTKPYVRKIRELVASVAQALKAGGEDVAHPLLEEKTAKAGRIAMLVITSNRGLCGGYNANLLRLAQNTLHELDARGIAVDLHVAGKKGAVYFRFQKRALAQNLGTIGENPQYAAIEPLATRFMDEYTAGKIDGLKIVYMQFLSAGTQRAAVLDLLPLAGGLPAGDAHAMRERFDFSPDPRTLLEALIPETVKLAIFQAFIEAAVSEQVGRMVAMKAATDNAEKMNKKLTQEYNRARQSQITSELSELMGGVEALK